LPNDAEKLCYAFLVANIDWDVASLSQWAAKVLSAQPVGCKLAQECIIPDDPWWRRARAKGAAAYEPLRAAIKGTRWEDVELDRIGAAMQRWQGVGRCDGLGCTELRRQVRKDPEVKGPKSAKGRSRLRIEHAVFDVAIRIRDSLAKLRREGQSDAPAGPSMFDEIAQLKKEKKKAEINVTAARLARDRANEGWYQAKARLAAKAAAVTAARGEEKAASALKVAEAKQAGKRKLDERVAAALKKLVPKAVADVSAVLETRTEQLKNARARARLKEWSAAESKRRLKRARLAETEARTLKRTMAELDASDSESESESGLEPATVQRPRRDEKRHGALEVRARRDEKGRWQAEDEDLHALRLAQLARGVAASTVPANVQDVLQLIAPELIVATPCVRSSQLQRGEVTLSGEAMAAWKFAACKRVMTFGWDESTKFGKAVFAVNFQLQSYDGTIEDVCLRGLTILPEGGTSKALLEHIEKRYFVYSRRMLTLWQEAHEKEHGAGSWAAAGGPSPENIGLHRLCDDTVLMSDTCNGARCTKRM